MMQNQSPLVMLNKNSGRMRVDSFSPGEEQLELRCTERINTYEEATDQEMEDTAMTDLGVTKSKSDGVNFTTE